jgi:hypothetical protein
MRNRAPTFAKRRACESLVDLTGNVLSIMITMPRRARHTFFRQRVKSPPSNVKDQASTLIRPGHPNAKNQHSRAHRHRRHALRQDAGVQTKALPTGNFRTRRLRKALSPAAASRSSALARPSTNSISPATTRRLFHTHLQALDSKGTPNKLTPNSMNPEIQKTYIIITESGHVFGTT